MGAAEGSGDDVFGGDEEILTFAGVGGEGGGGEGLIFGAPGGDALFGFEKAGGGTEDTGIF